MVRGLERLFLFSSLGRLFGLEEDHHGPELRAAIRLVQYLEEWG